ncbi:S-protein homolog 1-like [Benincasa hispida]|uniref:S-protein homolog 1-like n=1 Tax=Benincasa hispida TaxID=102211 RepID=UPI0019025A23|nr:S-protein homolog 1-like [Benincasa hispida]
MKKQMEMGRTKKQCVVLLFALFLVIFEETKAAELAKWQIHVVNGLSSGQILSVHCKSKDDDLGEHKLSVGTEFNWSFRKPNAQHSSFEAFWIESRSVWLYNMCYDSNCIWTAKDDGIYLKDNTAQRDILIHKWE